VIHDVFDGVAGDARVVEDAADDDGVVGGIVVAEAAAGVGVAPGELGATEESVKKAAVEVVEDFLEMVVVAASGADQLAAAHLADETRFSGKIVAGNIAAIASAMSALDGLAIELGEQDVGDRVQHGIGRAFEQVGEANVELSLAEADGVVDGDKGIKASMHRWRRGARTEFAIGLVKYFGEIGRHGEGRVAEAGRGRQLRFSRIRRRKESGAKFD
jgi:cytolysin (calcineurin-like family phosphatase)